MKNITFEGISTLQRLHLCWQIRKQIGKIHQPIKVEFHQPICRKQYSSLWYGGLVVSIKVRGCVFAIHACGDIYATLYDKSDGTELLYVKDKSNSGRFGVDVLPYLKTDHALYAAMGDTHKRYRLDMEHNNWWECFVYTAVLETVFRQASNSRIITNAYAINHNDTHLQFGDDFQFLEVQNSEEAAQLVIKNYLREVSLHGIEDVQILSPLRKRGAVAANALNETIRDLVNPPNNLKKEVKCGSRVFRVGDRIMQTANRINVSNGDVGVITDMKKEDDETITCVRLLDGRTLQYTQEMLEDLEFSYCTTIHKSQGQEYPVIIVPLLKEHYIMLRRNLLYTAVTRAKAKVILIGQKQAVFVAIHKCDVGQRNTVLADRIVAYYNRELSRRVA